MLNLHLSRYFRGQPPPPVVQQFNAWAHCELHDSLLYFLYWFFVLGFLGPTVAMSVLPWLFFYDIAKQKLVKDRLVEPKRIGKESSGPSSQLAVVITGCDSGIGKELAVCLASEGFVVFAGCLKEESIEQFSGMGLSIHPIVLDITSDDQVQACYETVQKWLSDESVKENRSLHALINNAGILVPGYFDWSTLSDYEACMNVNFFGLIRITKAFLPTLKQQSISGTYQHSQIVNIISVAGMSSALGMGASTYEASKHAAEAFTNSLRLELKMFGIRVVALNPSFFDTPLTKNMGQRFREETSKRMSSELQEEYGTEFIDKFVEHLDAIVNSSKWNLKVLIDSIVRVVKSKDPPAQLMIGADRYIHATLIMFPQWFRNWLVQLLLPSQTPKAMMMKKNK